MRTGAVSIVVTEVDGGDATLDAIADLDLPGDGHEVIIPVRGPGTAPSRVGSSVVREVRLEAAPSVVAVRNAAAAVARGEYLAFVDPDGVPDPRWVRDALDRFRADARVAAVVADAGPVVETRAFHWVGGFPSDGSVAEAGAELGWRLWRAGMAVVAGDEPVLAVGRSDAADDAAAADARIRSLVGAADTVPASVAPVRVVELGPLLGDHALPPPRVLVVTPDVLAPQMAGPAIRAFELSRVLAATPGIGGVELVSIVRCDLTDDTFPVRAVDDAALREAVARSDVVVVQGHVLDHHPWLAETDRVVIIDAYDPIQLEVLEQSRDRPAPLRRATAQHAHETIARLMARGDRFLVASAKQRDLLVGQLLASGRVNVATYDGDEGLHDLIGIVPFGIPDEPPIARAPALRGVVPGIGADDPLILWGGGVYNWFDPLTLLHAVDRLRTRLPQVRCYFMGMQHPHPEVPEMEMARRTRRLAHDLGLVGTHVFFNEGWVPYDERAGYLLESDVGVSTHLDHVETAYSYRTRVLDYLWAALPVVTTGGDSMAELVVERGFGVAVHPGDADALATALHDLLADSARNRACRDAIAAARPELRWSRAASDLVAMCVRPRRAVDLVDPRERAVRGDREAAAVWGVGWEASARGALASLRRGEWDELTRKARDRWAERRR